jgi:hypothetical protein
LSKFKDAGSLLEVGAAPLSLKQRTEDMRSVHSAIRDSFSFENSPMMEDISKLAQVPTGPELLSASELSQHEADVSLFLERSLSHLSARLSGQKSLLRLVLKKGGGDFDAAVSGMGKKGVSLNATFLNHIDAVMFGFWDGFFSGAITDFNEAKKSPTCTSGRTVVANHMKALTGDFQRFWKALKRVHVKMWRQAHRNELRRLAVAFFKSLFALVAAYSDHLWSCEATQTVALIAFVMMGAMAFQWLALTVAAPIALFVKALGMILRMSVSLPYLAKTGASLVGLVGKAADGECDDACQLQLSTKFAAMIGCVAEVFVLSGLPHLMKISKSVKGVHLTKLMGLKNFAKGGFKDLKKIMDLLSKGKKFALGKIPFVTKFTKKQKALQVYRAKQLQSGKKIMEFSRWSKNYDNLVKARKAKAMLHAHKVAGTGKAGAKAFHFGKRAADPVHNVLLAKGLVGFGKAKNAIAEGFVHAIKEGEEYVCDKLAKGACKYIANNPTQEVKGIFVHGFSETIDEIKKVEKVLVADPLNWLNARKRMDHQHHVPKSFGVLGTCSGDVQGLCFDTRISKCFTGRPIRHGRCPGKKNIRCCPGAGVIQKFVTGA